jgi:hypothetical protein
VKKDVKLVLLYSLLNFGISGGYLYLKEWKKWAVSVLALIGIYAAGYLFKEGGKLPLQILPLLILHIVYCTLDRLLIARKINLVEELNISEIYENNLDGVAANYLVKRING